jgi:hypothetical protein
MRSFDNTVLRKSLGTKKDEVTRGLERKLYKGAS